MQWVFDKEQMFESDSSHLTLVSSGADEVMAVQNDELIALALRELREALPDARAAKVLRASVVRERRATFSIAPGQPKRPGTATAVAGLVLAGDWIETGPARDDRRRGDQRTARGRGPLMNSVVVHYQEIALKGRNRPWFIARLVRNIKTATSDLDVTRVMSKMGRIEVTLGSAEAWDAVADRLRHVFGIANFSRAALVPLDVDVIAKAILDDLGDLQVSTFRVSARRADKRFPLTSPQIEREVGGRIKQAKGWTVNLDDPAFTIHVEALTGEAFYYFGKEAGPGGMPTGVSGRVVASALRRHRFAGGGVSIDEARLPRHSGTLSQLSDSVARVAGKGPRACGAADALSAVHAALHGGVRRDSAAGHARRPAPAARGDLPATDVADRRGDRRIERTPAALVTGEVIGQVASQTLENMATIGSVVTLPVFRPLVGMDKDEITVEAQRLGTYPISIIEDQDCCQLFTPKHPATKARREDIDAAERSLPIDDFVRQAVEAAVVEDFNYPVITYPVTRR